MKHKHIFRHPVGTMPTHARWYLAGISMLALLLVAVHFAIQVHAQQEARRMVMQWMQQSGASVEWVRYRLLRSVLTLENVSMERDDNAIVMGKVFLHGNLHSLMDRSPHVTSVEISGAEMHLNAALMKQFLQGGAWDGEDVFQQVWASAQSLVLHKGRIYLQRAGEDQSSLVLEQVETLFSGISQQRNIKAQARWHGAPLQLDMNARAGAEGPSQVQGQIHWKDVDGANVAEAFDLEPLHGRLAGKMQWHAAMAASGNGPGYEINGHVRLLQADTERPDGVAAAEAEVTLKGWMNSAAWQLNTQVKNWPVGLWRRYAPVWYGHRLVAGVFDGEVTWRGALESDAWSAGCAKGAFRDLRYQPETEAIQDVRQSGWYIGRLQLADASLQMPSRRFSAAQAHMVDASLRFTPGDGAESSEAPWQLAVEEGSFERLRLSVAVNNSQDVFQMPPMQGKAVWRGDGHVEFDLQSGAMVNESRSDEAVWALHGQGKMPAGQPASLVMYLLAEDVPLVQVRPLIPGLSGGQQGSAVELAGLAKLDLAVHVRESMWQLKGHISASDIRLAHAATEWWAEQLDVEIAQAGMGLSEQLLSQLEVQGWRYITALRPLSGESGETATDTFGSQWLAGLQDGRWGLERIRLEDGSISVGRADVVWMDDISIHMDGSRQGRKAKMQMQARLNGGSVHVSGSLDMRGEALRISLNGKVRDALPFFVGDWLSLSGAPRIIRGRLSADFSLEDVPQGGYRAKADFYLRRGLLESGVFVNDPLLPRIGFGMHEVFTRLSGDKDILSLNVSHSGDWQKTPLNWARIGEAFLSAIREASQKTISPVTVKKTTPAAESQIRMHDRDQLSHNERTRLRKVWRETARHKQWVIDLVPQFSQQEIDMALTQRVRYTQELIEAFMSKRGIGRARLFPIWPTSEHRTGESNGIRVRAGPAY
ncbi:MAG: hypothetical protein ACE5F3_06470 [Mariprofundaceae bacterium]